MKFFVHEASFHAQTTWFCSEDDDPCGDLNRYCATCQQENHSGLVKNEKHLVHLLGVFSIVQAIGLVLGMWFDLWRSSWLLLHGPSHQMLQ